MHETHLEAVHSIGSSHLAGPFAKGPQDNIVPETKKNGEKDKKNPIMGLEAFHVPHLFKQSMFSHCKSNNLVRSTSAEGHVESGGQR